MSFLKQQENSWSLFFNSCLPQRHCLTLARVCELITIQTANHPVQPGSWATRQVPPWGRPSCPHSLPLPDHTNSPSHILQDGALRGEWPSGHGECRRWHKERRSSGGIKEQDTGSRTEPGSLPTPPLVPSPLLRPSPHGPHHSVHHLSFHIVPPPATVLLPFPISFFLQFYLPSSHRNSQTKKKKKINKCRKENKSG